MVNISTPKYCPYCKEPLFKESDDTGFVVPFALRDRCPHCYKILQNPDNKHFETPDYIFHQKNSLIENLKRDKLNPDSNDYLDRVTEFGRQELNWYRTCLHEDRVAAFADALGIIQNIVYSRSMGAEFKQILTLAKQIGAIALSIQELHKSGVELYDGEIRSLRPLAGDPDGSQASAVAGRDP